jgi:tRNA U34 5-carboxymethylaminomethyl modifying enzyme MnmG/GidA
MSELNSIDTVVIGAGHSGCEAARLIACKGYRTLLLTINLDAIALVSGNPLLDVSGANLKMMERIGITERPAGIVESSMMVIDRREYFICMKERMENVKNLRVRQAEATSIIEKNGIILIKTRLGDQYRAKAVVICAGTFLKARCIYDGYETPGGRHGEIASDDLCRSLEDMGFEFEERDVSSSPVVRIAGELKKKCEQIEIKYSYRHTNSKTTPIYCYLYKLDDNYSLLFVPLGVGNIEYYVSDNYYKNIPLDVFNKYIKKLEDKSLIMLTRPPYKVKYQVLKNKCFCGINREKSVHESIFFAGAVCGSTGILQSIMDGINAGMDAVNYIKSRENKSNGK